MRNQTATNEADAKKAARVALRRMDEQRSTWLLVCLCYTVSAVIAEIQAERRQISVLSDIKFQILHGQPYSRFHKDEQPVLQRIRPVTAASLVRSVA